MKIEITYKTGKKTILENVVFWSFEKESVGFKLSDGKEYWCSKNRLENVKLIKMKFKKGQKVKYIGTEFPEHTGKTYVIDRFMKGGLFTLSTDQSVNLEGGGGVWGVSFIARVDELEEVK